MNNFNRKLEEEMLLQPKTKKKVSFETKPLKYEDSKSKVCYKLKILMTKEEAFGLLSKCKDGGVLELNAVARELVHIPINRISLVSSRDCCLIHEGGDDHKEL